MTHDEYIDDEDRRPGPAHRPESPREFGTRRQARRADRRAKARLHPMTMVPPLLIVLAAAVAIAFMAPRAHSVAAPAAQAWKAVATATATPAPAAPTPTFASFRGVPLHLPVAASSITALAFHQTSYTWSYQLKPLIKMRSDTAARAAAKAAKAAGSQSVEPSGTVLEDEKGVWTGWALQTWRSAANGKSRTAVDCGAKPGTPVIAPLSGTVMLIRPYKLYHHTDDFEINIKPDGWNDVDLIVLHVTDPLVKEGDRVVGGITQLASVRNLKAVLTGIQLANYTSEGGDHTHVQLNRIKKPNETWIVGQDPPGLNRKSP